jgi:hypothetical protein
MNSAIHKTCIALAFLVTTAALADSEHWNATPNDVNNMLKSMKGMMDVNYSMEIKSLSQINPDPERNPVLFRSGHFNYEYTDAQRKKLREFALSGGMIIYNTGLGSAPFYRSTISEMKKIFPEQPIQRLTSDHPIFHSYYDIDHVTYLPGVKKSGYRGDEPWFDGIEINCRVVALVSRWGMAVGWEDHQKDEFQAYTSESAKKLGINIFAYASAMRAWAKNDAQAMTFVDKTKISAGKVSIGQIMYDGVWKTRHAGISVLLHTFHQKTDVPVKFGLKELRLSDPAIFDAPLLYLTGHEHFTLTDKEIAKLRQYLTNGGFLFAEACCGRKGFDQAFRQVMKRVMPSQALKTIPANNVVFRSPNTVTTVGVTPTLQADTGTTTIHPRLEGIDVGGVYSVIYSPLGLSGGWEMSQSPYARAYNDISAIKLGQNILLYAATQ